MTETTLYTMPSCGPCQAVKHAMRARGIPFKTVDLSQDANAAHHVQSLGYRSAPVTVAADGSHWHGLDLDRITGLAVMVAS